MCFVSLGHYTKVLGLAYQMMRMCGLCPKSGKAAPKRRNLQGKTEVGFFLRSRRVCFFVTFSAQHPDLVGFGRRKIPLSVRLGADAIAWRNRVAHVDRGAGSGEGPVPLNGNGKPRSRKNLGGAVCFVARLAVETDGDSCGSTSCGKGRVARRGREVQRQARRSSRVWGGMTKDPVADQPTLGC